MEKRKTDVQVPERLFTGARVLQILETRDQAMKAGEIAKLLGVTRQHIYKMAADGRIPSFQVGDSVRFDPAQVADWLRRKMPQPIRVAERARMAV
jgi:excisionase family DNA binding protein